MDRLNEILREAATLRPGVVQLLDLQGWLRQEGGEDDPAVRPDGVHFADDRVQIVGAWLATELRRGAREG
jgi:hypothetical protein